MGRQIVSEIERVGLRLHSSQHQAEAGHIVLLYGDDSEALTHPYFARVRAKSGADLRVPAPGQAKKVATLGSLDHVTRKLIAHTSPTPPSSNFAAHLEQRNRAIHEAATGLKRERMPIPLVIHESLLTCRKSWPMRSSFQATSVSPFGKIFRHPFRPSGYRIADWRRRRAVTPVPIMPMPSSAAEAGSGTFWMLIVLFTEPLSAMWITNLAVSE